MSTKIDLQFVKSLDLDLLEKGVEVWIIRIIGQVKFKTIDGWTRVYEAIIDTGAPVSFIPKSIWTRIESKIETDYVVSGIVPKKECSLPVKVGEVNCMVVGVKATSNPLRIKAYFAPTDKVPLIIGLYDFLTLFRLCCDYRRQEVFLET